MKTRCIFALLIALCVADAAAAEQLLAIYPLQSDELSKQETRNLDEVLRSQAQYLSDIILHSRAKTERVLKRVTGRKGSCESRLDCLVEVGELSAASLLVAGTASREGGNYRLDLKLIDVSKEKIVNRAQGDISGDARGVAASARDLIGRLLQQDQFSGVLHVRMLIPGARVSLDDLEVGMTPMDPIPSLKPRVYSLSIVLEGFEPYQKPVQIRHATITNVQVNVVETELQVEVTHQALQSEHPLPPEAELVAESLRRAAPPRPPAPPPTPGENTPEVLVVAAEEVPSSLSDDDELAPAQLGGVLLGSGGAVFAVFGTAGLITYGMGAAAAGETVSDGVVVDRAGYAQSQEDRDLFTGLGLAGSITVPVGLAMLAGGLALYMWDAHAEADLD